MALHHNPRIVTSGLVLALDAGDVNSYPGSGTTWYDVSGNNFDATLVNGPSFAGTGPGTSFTFDGANDFGRISHNSILKPTQGISFEAFVTIASLDSAYRWVIRCGWAGSPYFFGINSNNKFILTINDQPGLYGNTSSLITATTGTHHIVGTYDKTSVKMYVDGADTGFSYSYTADINTNTLPLIVGGGDSNGDSNGNTQFWKESIHTVRMYNRALSATEIEQNYLAQKSRFGL